MPGWKYGCNSWQLLTQHVDFTKKGALLQKQSSVGHSDLLPRSKIPQLFEWIASRSPTPHCRCYKSANHLHPKIFPSTCEHIWILPSKHANPCSNTVWNLLRYHSSKEHGFYYRLGISILKKSFNPVGSGLSKQVNDFSNLVAVALMASSNILDTYARPWKSKTGTADENPCHLSKLSWVGFPQAEILSCQQLSTSGPCNNTFSLNGNWANYFNSWLLKAPMSTSKHTVMNFVNWSQIILLQHDRPKQGGKCCHSWTLATFDRRKLTRCVLEPHGDPGHKAKASAGRFHTMHNKNIQTNPHFHPKAHQKKACPVSLVSLVLGWQKLTKSKLSSPLGLETSVPTKDAVFFEIDNDNFIQWSLTWIWYAGVFGQKVVMFLAETNSHFIDNAYQCFPDCSSNTFY